MISKIKKPVSILLSLIMVFSMFAIVPITASAAEKTIAEGVIYKLGDTIVLPGEDNYYVKENRYSTRTVSGNGTITRFEGDEYSYELEIEGWYIYTSLDTFDYWEEMEQGLSVLGIKFTGSGTQSDPYLLKLAFGEVESTWAGEGEGTERAPWLINDVNDLLALSANVQSGMTYSGKYLKLTADIDCSGTDAVPIGGDKTFAGTFDGDGNTITYSIISSENDAPKGLFAKIGSAGTVKNLNVAGSIVNTASYAGPAGGIAAYNSGLIENCYSAVDITKGCDRGTGGIAAWNEEGATIRYCAASGTLTWTGASGYYAYIGGITGEVYESSVNNSTSLCDVSAENANEYAYAGRFIGRNVNNYATPNCYYLSTATIVGDNVNSSSAEPKTAAELAVIGQEVYDAGYTVYGLALGAVAPNPDQEAADAVIALINAIGTVEYTDACKAKIDAARAAYDALTAEQKELVTNYSTLTKAEEDYEALIPVTYTVTWKNGDTVLETDTGVAEGATPSYDGETPTKDGVTFAGWTDSHGVFYAKDAALPEVTADETYTAVFELTIGSVDEWNSFAASVKGGNTYSGITVRMTADVGPVTTMVDGTFSGTFDGDGHTLTVNISGGSTSAATFAYVKDATIQNLRLEGTVTSSGIHTAALVKSVSGTGSTCTIKNVDIYADVNCSNDYIGGFIGHAGTANTVNIENSIFAGSINKTGSNQGNFIGAFIGWSQTLTATINNCAFTGSYNNIKSFNNIGFSYNAPTKVTVSGFYSNASEVFVANVNHGTRLYVPSSSYPTSVALVKNNDGETFYSAFSDALAAWTDGSTLALLADVTCDSMISVPATDTKTLDLNGNALSLSYSSTKVEVNGTLTIQSTASGGSITPTTKSRVINVVDGGTLNIESGTINGYNADRAVIGGVGTITLNGGKIVTPASNAFSPDGVATLNLNGGEIECTSDSTSMGVASAVWANGNTTINWSGTAITTNTGDGIRMKSAGNGTVNVTGGSFTATSSSLPEEGGYAIYCNSNMGTLNLEGNPSISGRGIYLTNDKVINITNDLSNTNPISVTMQTLGVFTSGLSGNGDASNFANGNGTGYALTLNASGEAQIVSTYTVTWKNYDNTEIGTSTVNAGETPAFSDEIGEIKAKPEDDDYTYTFSGWTPELTAATGDAEYTATFTAVPKPKLFHKHSVSLGGDIGVNFYLNPEVLDTYNGAKTVTFTWDGNEQTVDVPATATADGYKVTCNVVAAQMAHKIHIEVYAGDEMIDDEYYSVQDYAETVYANPSAYDSEKPDELKALAKAMLNYGAMSQTVFADSLTEAVDLPTGVVGVTDFSGITADDIAAAIRGSASDLDAAAAAFGAEFYTSSLIYLSRNTLRLYFTPASKTVGALNGLDFSGNLSEYYYFKDVENIAAAELDNQQTFSVNGTEFTYSALDYAKAVVESGKMEPEQKNLAKALYLYNQAANAYFDAAHVHTPAAAVRENEVPASCTAAGSYDEVVRCSECNEVISTNHVDVPAAGHQITAVAEVPATTEAAGVQAHYECSVCHALFTDAQGNNATTAEELVIPKIEAKIIVLDYVTSNTTVEDGYTVTGTLKGNYKISIAAGATVTLRNVNITSLSNNQNARYAGITPFGDATIILEGENTVKGGSDNYPGVYAATNATLTVDGTGSLDASSNGYACGIGGGKNVAAGNIVINGGTITATGGYNASGIGSGFRASCGDITITGGTVIANGGYNSAGIGSGFYASCGAINITGGTVNATGGEDGAGIGSGYNATCGDITITGGTVHATGGGDNGAGIGSGYNATCGDITITASVIQVTATKGEDAESIGEGYDGSCGTVTIADPSKVTQN